ncbi:zinc finger MYM-type protein 1-like, partial [Aphis craccivora]
CIFCNFTSYNFPAKLMTILCLCLFAFSILLIALLIRLKTWMRSRMGEERLTGLALLNTHRDIDIDVEKIIDRFAACKKRSIKFTYVILRKNITCILRYDRKQNGMVVKHRAILNNVVNSYIYS